MLTILIGIVGFLATSTSLVRVWPQAIQTWKQRNNLQALEGLSIPTQWFTLSNSILWMTYGILLYASTGNPGTIWVAAPSIINAPTAPLIIVLIYRGRKKSRDLE